METPGYAPTYLAEYLENSGHNVYKIVHPNKFHRGSREKFIPIYSHWKNALNTRAQFRGLRDVAFKEYGTLHFDVAIAPDPSLIWALKPFRRDGSIKKLIYWRLDYYPNKYPGVFNSVYQHSERRAQEVDEVWSIADPKLDHVLDTLTSKADIKYVPFLLPHSPVEYQGARKNQAIWMGPDLDNSRTTAKEGVLRAGASFLVADYSSTRTWLSDDDLDHELNTSKVGIALYRPGDPAFKPWSDPSRIRTSLAHGLPVVTTKVAPVWKEIQNREAGVAISELEVNRVDIAVHYILDHFEEMSANAYALAKDYTFSREWIDL